MLRKHLPLIIGLAIPAAMVLLVAASIVVPGLLVKPQHDFLYLTSADYATNWDLAVEEGTLVNVRQKNGFSTDGSPVPVLYVHDMTTNESRRVTVEEAKKLTLDPSQISPDGFELVQGGSRGGFLFYSGNADYNAQYLRGHGVSKRMNVKTEGQRSYGSIRFIGWIIP